MCCFTIRFKTRMILFLIGLLTLTASIAMIWSVNLIKEDQGVVVALERQRMLSQAMAKSALGFVMARSGYQTMEERVRMLDAYITELRKFYVHTFHALEKKADANPMATPFIRKINQTFGPLFDMEVEILAEHATQKQYRYQDRLDWDALTWLRANPLKIYGKAIKEKEGMFLRFYTADRATETLCLSCHRDQQERVVKIGDILGLRRYIFRFVGDVALGKAELEPSLTEYYHSRDMFRSTLMAISSGGLLPTFSGEGGGKLISPLQQPAQRAKIEAIQTQFDLFLTTVQALFKSELGSESYRLARQEIPIQSNRLRLLSEDLLRLHTQTTQVWKSRTVLWIGIATLSVIFLIILIAAHFLQRAVVRPLAVLQRVIGEIAEGDLKVRISGVGGKSEIDHIGSGVNQMSSNLVGMVRNMRLQSASINAVTHELVTLEKSLDRDTKAVYDWVVEGIKDGNDLNHKIKLFADQNNLKDQIDPLIVVSSRLIDTNHKLRKQVEYLQGSIDYARLLTGMQLEVSQALQEADAVFSTEDAAFDIQSVKRAYLQWLSQLGAVIRGRTTMTALEITETQSSFFGHWYENEGRQKLGDTPLFFALGEAHQVLYESAQEVVRLVEDRDRKSAIRQMVHFNKLRKRLFVLLNQLYIVAHLEGDRRREVRV